MGYICAGMLWNFLFYLRSYSLYSVMNVGDFITLLLSLFPDILTSTPKIVVTADILKIDQSQIILSTGNLSLESKLFLCDWCKNSSAWEFSVWLRKLKQVLCINLEGGVGRGMGGSFKRERMYVYLWLIHVEVWQKTAKFCKVIILQ